MGRRITQLLCAISVITLAHAAPTLGIEGDHFTIDGKPQFLLLVSYFDAVRASDQSLESDFAWLRANRFDGLRIFPNWWNVTKDDGFPPDTLFDGDGNIRPAQLARLKTVLGRATAHNLIVDLSFAHETVRGLSALRDDQVGKPQGELPVNQVRADACEHAFVSVTKELLPYRNLFFDIQNEFNGRVTHLSNEEVSRFAAAIKRADPSRLLTASLANEIGPEEVAKRTNAVGVDVIAWHESRNPWRFDAMDALARAAKSVSQKPLYFGEPASFEDAGLSVDQFLVAVTKAKAGGAAAWTLHTEHGFDLHARSLRDQLTAPERQFAEQAAARLDATPWGISRNR